MQETGPELPADIDVTVRHALEEDVGEGDVTAALIPPLVTASATVVCREAAVI